MIRPITCLCVLLAGASGLYLYQSKHRAQLLDREIMRTIRETARTEERVGVLRAEWALLNEPERLAELSQQHLGLRALAPQQFVPIAQLAARLPAVPPPDAGPAADAPVAEQAEEEEPAVVVAQAHMQAPMPAAPPRIQPAAPPAFVSRPPAPQRPRVLAPVLPAYAVPIAAPPPRGGAIVQRVALPSHAAAARPVPVVGSALGSALGGARPALAPPVPYTTPADPQ